MSPIESSPVAYASRVMSMASPSLSRRLKCCRSMAVRQANASSCNSNLRVTFDNMGTNASRSGGYMTDAPSMAMRVGLSRRACCSDPLLPPRIVSGAKARCVLGRLTDRFSTESLSGAMSHWAVSLSRMKPLRSINDRWSRCILKPSSLIWGMNALTARSRMAMWCGSNNAESGGAHDTTS